MRLLTLARQTVRGRLRMFVSTFVVAAMATAVVSAGGVLVDSGVRGDVAPERYAGVPIVVAGRQQLPDPLQDGGSVMLPERVRLPASLADQVATIPGVRDAVADRGLPVSVAANGHVVASDGATTVVAQAWASAALWPVRTVDGRPPNGEGEVALDERLVGRAGVSLGDEVRLTSSGGTHPYEVVGLVAANGASPGRNLAVFVAGEVLTGLVADPERLDAVGVLVEDGADPAMVADAIRAQTDPAIVVLTGRDRAAAETLELTLRNQQLVEFGGAFGVTALMLAVFVIAATLGMVILQRGREMALLRAVGATPRQVRRMLVAEAGLVAVLAALAGLLPGLLLGAALFGVLRDAGTLAAATTLRLGPMPLLVALLSAFAAACAAAWLAGRRAARLDPAAALTEAALEPRRIGWFRVLVGGLLLAGGLALSALASTLEGEAGASAVVGVLLTLIIGIAALGPLLASGAGVLLDRLVAPRAAAGFLAVANLRARARRLASASTPLALAVAVIVTMVGSLAIEASAAVHQGRERLIADRVVLGPHGVPAGFAEAVRSMSGVSSAVAVTSTSMGVLRRELFDEQVFELRPAVGLSRVGVDAVLDLEVQAGSVSPLRPGGVAVSTEMARSVGVQVGGALPVWLGDGTELVLQVQAIYQRSLGLGDLIVARDMVAAHVTDPMPDHVLVAFDDGADRSALDRRLDDLTARSPGTTIADQAALQEQLASDADREASINHLFVGVLAAFVTVAMVNSIVLATAERRREFALLRLIGASPRQVRRMVRREAVVLVSYGTLLGLLVAAATLVPFGLGIADTPMPAVPAGFLGLVVAGAFAFGLVATEIPARLALRDDPTQALTRG